MWLLDPLKLLVEDANVNSSMSTGYPAGSVLQDAAWLVSAKYAPPNVSSSKQRSAGEKISSQPMSLIK